MAVDWQSEGMLEGLEEEDARSGRVRLLELLYSRTTGKGAERVLIIK